VTPCCRVRHSAVGGRSVGESPTAFRTVGAPGRDVMRRNPRPASNAFSQSRAIPISLGGAWCAAADAGSTLNRRLDSLKGRTGFLDARGIDVSAIPCRHRVRPRLDYYTGRVFELHDPSGVPTASWSRADAMTASPDIGLRPTPIEAVASRPGRANWR